MQSDIPPDDLFPVEIEKSRRRGRGATRNESGRFERQTRAITDDGWAHHTDDTPPLRTEVLIDHTRRIISRNTSPDVPFDRSVNPYKGCEHGCIYCYARPTHEYLGMSAGLDFETQIFAKPNAAGLLEGELRKPGYTPRTLAIGTNTDPYQPIERERHIMRDILEVLEAFQHPVSIVTKGGLVTRDTDILARMARNGLAQVSLSVTSLDSSLSRKMEPRCAAPQVRLRAIRTLAQAGIPVGVLIGPVIPALNDHEIEPILAAAARAGARYAHYTVLRLPGAVAPLFKEWLKEAYPKRARRILRYVRETHGGQDYAADWYKRIRGQGVYANLIARRFERARRAEGLETRTYQLSTRRFKPPPRAGEQLRLF